MPTYRVTAPDGRTFKLTGDSPPTDADLEQVFASLPATPRPPRAPGAATIGEQLAAKEAAAAAANVAPPPGMHARPGGRATGLNIRQYDEAARGGASVVPFTGVEAPDTARGTAGQVAGTAALLAAPAVRVAAAARGALGAVPAVVAGAKAAAAQAAPAVKYEAVKMGLESMGVPSSIALPLAIIASGYRRGAKPTAPAPAAAPAPAPAPPAVRTGTTWGAPPPAAPAVGRPAPAPAPAPTLGGLVAPPVAPAPVPRAAPPVAATPPQAPAAAPVARGATLDVPWAARPAGQQSPAWLANDLALAARRAGLRLTPAQEAAAGQLVTTGGQTPVAAVRAVGGAPGPVAAPPAAAAKPRISADELLAYGRLRARGLSDADAQAAVIAQRALATLTPAQMRAEIAARTRNLSPARD